MVFFFVESEQFEVVIFEVGACAVWQKYPCRRSSRTAASESGKVSSLSNCGAERARGKNVARASGRIPQICKADFVYALYVQGRHVLSLQWAHSKMYQCGPEWQRLQCQRINVVSDLIILNVWSQVPGTAIAVRVGG